MSRVTYVSLALVILSIPASAQDMSKIPTEIKQHMESMVGSWTFIGTQGKRTFSGEETIRLTNNNTALLQEGYFNLTDGTKEHYVILSGWDGSKKTVLVRGYTTEGLTWSGEWKRLKAGRWEGTASGGTAKFEVRPDTMRYEDAGDGIPWISEFSRKKK